MDSDPSIAMFIAVACIIVIGIILLATDARPPIGAWEQWHTNRFGDIAYDTAEAEEEDDADIEWAAGWVREEALSWLKGGEVEGGTDFWDQGKGIDTGMIFQAWLGDHRVIGPAIVSAGDFVEGKWDPEKLPSAYRACV